MNFKWQFLIGAGFQETIDFLERSDNPWSLEIISYLTDENIKSEEDNEPLEKWFDFRYKYFFNE